MVYKDAKFLCGDMSPGMAMFFTLEADKFKSSVWIEKGVNRVNAKGILDVLSLKVHENDEVRIIADGIDEVEAVEAMIEFIVDLG